MIHRLALYGLLGAALIGGVLWQVHAYGDRRAAAVQALWDLDTAARDKATQEAIAAAEAAKLAALQHNQEVEREYQAKLAAIESSRDQYVGLFERARDQVRAISTREGASIADALRTGEARGAERIGIVARRVEAACERIPAESRANANQLDALIAELTPQL